MRRMQVFVLLCLLLECEGVSHIAFGKAARTIFLDDRRTEIIHLSVGHSTILNFPTKPSKVVLGNKGLFTVEYIENDLAIAALQHGARSNLFVYLEGRRLGFDLLSQGQGGDEIVLIRDLNQKKIRSGVKVKHE